MDSGAVNQKLALSLAEAAKMLSISPRHLQNLTKTGEIRCRKAGRRVLYPLRELQAWLNQSDGEPSGV